MQCIDADQIASPIVSRDTRVPQPVGNDGFSEMRAGDGARSRVRDLTFPDIAVTMSKRDLRKIGSLPSGCALDRHAVMPGLFDLDVTEISDGVWRHVRRRIMDLVEQLLLARRRSHAAS